jgi:hypothetical protein
MFLSKTTSMDYWWMSDTKIFRLKLLLNQFGITDFLNFVFGSES